MDVSLASCYCKQRDRFYINKFEHPVKVEIQRFDVDFIDLDTNNTLASLKELEQKHPGFYSLFLRDVLSMHLADSTDNALQITNFLNDSVFRRVNQKVKDVFKDTEPIEQDLTEAFSIFIIIFPTNHCLIFISLYPVLITSFGY